MLDKLIRMLRGFVLGHTVIILIILCGIAEYDFITTVYVVLSVLLIHAFAQLTNMIHDRKLDAINIYKRNRPTVTGEVKIYRAIILSVIMIALSIFFASKVNELFLLRALVLATISGVFSLSFTVRKNKYVHAGWMGVCRGLLPPWVVLGGEGLVISTLMFIWALALNPVKDIKDIEADFNYGIKTIAQKGKHYLRNWMHVGIGVFYATLIALIVCGQIPYRALILLITIPFTFSIPQTIDYPAAYSDNCLAYDLYWNFMTLHYLLLFVALKF